MDSFKGLLVIGYGLWTLIRVMGYRILLLERLEVMETIDLRLWGIESFRLRG